MNEEQMNQVVEQISEMLQQGVDPNQIMQQLVEAGVPQEQAQQLIQAVMEEMQGGQGAPPAGGEQSGAAPAGGGQGSQDDLAIIQEAIQVLSPQGLAMLLQAWDSLPQQQKQQMVQQLSQMSQEQQTQGQEQAPQDGRASALFGDY